MAEHIDSYYQRQRHSKKDIVEAFKKLQEIEKPAGQNFTVEAYFLLDKNHINDDENNQIYGIKINLGNFKNEKKAIEKCKEYQSFSKYKCIKAVPVCTWANLTTKPQEGEKVDYFDPKTKKVINDAADQEVEHYRKEYENKQRIIKEIEEEMETKDDKTHINHYIQNMYSLCLNYSQKQKYEQKLKFYNRKYEEKLQKIKEQHKRQPEMKNKWRKVFKEQLCNRGESDTYQQIISIADEVEPQMFKEN